MNSKISGLLWASSLPLGLLVACGDGLDSPRDSIVRGGAGAETSAPEEPEGSPEAEVDPIQSDSRPLSEGSSSADGGKDAPRALEGAEQQELAPDAPTEAKEPSAGPKEELDCILPEPGVGPVGYGERTTGGGDAAAVVVASFAEAEAALAAYRTAFRAGSESALVLRYEGVFDFAQIKDVCVQHTLEPQRLQIKEMANVTFEGAPGSSANFGIHINRATNVIVRNMTLGLLPGGGASDAISIEGNGTNGDVENVWIDHNELFSSTKDDCPGAGDTEFDGLIDIKKGARRITVSYNYLHDHQKTGLLGFSESDDTERYVTFHHNRYEDVVSRIPLHRFGYMHAFNNYYGNVSGSGINVRNGGVALIESNFFENVKNPVTSRFSPAIGYWDLRNNHIGGGITWDSGSDTLANAEDWQTTMEFPASELDYDYAPDAAACVAQIVRAMAGAKL